VSECSAGGYGVMLNAALVAEPRFEVAAVSV